MVDWIISKSRNFKTDKIIFPTPPYLNKKVTLANCRRVFRPPSADLLSSTALVISIDFLTLFLDYGWIRENTSCTRRSRPLYRHSISIYRVIYTSNVHWRESRAHAGGADIHIQRHITARVCSCVRQCGSVFRLWDGYDTGFQKEKMWRRCSFTCSSLHCDCSLSTQKSFGILDCK